MYVPGKFLPLQFKHSVDGEMIIEGEDGYRQIFTHGLEVDGQICCQGGLADPAFFGGDGYDVWICMHVERCPPSVLKYDAELATVVDSSQFGANGQPLWWYRLWRLGGMHSVIDVSAVFCLAELVVTMVI